jgi:hypothetical protein
MLLTGSQKKEEEHPCLKFLVQSRTGALALYIGTSLISEEI